MTSALDITIGTRDLTVEFRWQDREPATATDPGSPGGPEIENIWERGVSAIVSDREMDTIVDKIKRMSRADREDMSA